MNRRDFIKKLLLLPAIFVAPDVLGRIIPEKISGFKLKPFTTKDTLIPPVRNITTIKDGTYSIDKAGTFSGTRIIGNPIYETKPNYGKPALNAKCQLKLNGGETIYYDSGSPYSGTRFPVGKQEAPVNNIQDALKISANLRKITPEEYYLKKAGFTKKERFKYSRIESDFKLNSETRTIDWVGGSSKKIYSIKEFEEFLKSDAQISYNLAGNSLKLNNRLIGHEAVQHLNYGSIKDKLGTYAYIESFSGF